MQLITLLCRLKDELWQAPRVSVMHDGLRFQTFTDPEILCRSLKPHVVYERIICMVVRNDMDQPRKYLGSTEKHRDMAVVPTRMHTVW